MNILSADSWVNATQAALCEAIADTNPADRYAAAVKFLEASGTSQAIQFAETNEVAPHLFHALSHGESKAQISHLKTAHDETAATISEYLNELDRVGDLLDSADIAMVALKNAGIARGLYPCAGCCPMGDLDVLVDPRHFRNAHQVLVDDGFQFEFRSPFESAELDEAELGGGSEYWKLLPSGKKLWFELQWRPVAGRWIRPDQEPAAADLISRSVPIEGSVVRMLSPEDNLLQVALHTAKHTYVRAPGFRLHTDVDRIVRRQDVNWSSFVDFATAINVKTAVYFSLAIPKAIFGTPIPEDVLNDLRPGTAKANYMHRWLRNVDLFGPLESKFSKLEYIQFNALLYDTIGGLARGVFPDSKWMKQRYEFENGFLLPWYHARRIGELLFRRSRT